MGGELIGSTRRTLSTLLQSGVTLLNDSISYYTSAGDDDYDDDRHFFSLQTRYALEDIVRDGDDQEAVERLLGDSRLAFSGSLCACMAGMIENRRNACLRATLSRTLFPSNGDPPSFNRNAGLTRLLQGALAFGNVEAADFLLAQEGFSIVLGDGDHHHHHLWKHAAGSDWNLDEFKLLVFKNGDKAAGLAPTPLDVRNANSPEDMVLLIDLALFCDEENGRLGRARRAFDASRFLNEGVLLAWGVRDAERSEVIRRLCQLGAKADWAVFGRHCPGHPESEAVLRSYEQRAGGSSSLISIVSIVS